jgi:hypothetical protein
MTLKFPILQGAACIYIISRLRDIEIGCDGMVWSSVSQTVVRGFSPCGPLRLNISPKKDRENKFNVNCLSHTVVENLKPFTFKGDE